MQLTAAGKEAFENHLGVPRKKVRIFSYGASRPLLIRLVEGVCQLVCVSEYKKQQKSIILKTAFNNQLT